MADRVIGSQLSVRENPHSLNADFLKIYFFYKSKPVLRFVLMKTAFILCFIGAAISCADTWQHKYTFPEGQPSIAFNGTEFLYIQDFNNETKSMTVVKSSDLSSWTTHSNIPLPEDLFSFDTAWEGAWLSLLEITSLPNGCFIIIVQKTIYPEMGNWHLYDTFSLCSVDGIVWSDLAEIPEFPWGGESMKLNTFDNSLIFLRTSGSPPGSMTIGATSCYLLKYNPNSNEWTNLFPQSIGLSHEISLFQDKEKSYLVLSSSNNYWNLQDSILCSDDGFYWEVLPSPPTEECNAIAAHNSMIFSKTHTFTLGRGWEPAPYSELNDVAFNGNRLAGRQSEYLIYSDDLGKTMTQKLIPNMTSATIFEANNQYVAILNIRTNFSLGHSYYTSIYTLGSSLERASVSSIENLRSRERKVEFSSVSNAVYQFESCTNLVNPVWNSYGLPVIGSGNDVAIDLPENLSAPIYFRVKALNH